MKSDSKSPSEAPERRVPADSKGSERETGSADRAPWARPDFEERPSFAELGYWTAPI